MKEIFCLSQPTALVVFKWLPERKDYSRSAMVPSFQEAFLIAMAVSDVYCLLLGGT